MQSFHALYQRYAKDVYRFALALSGNRALAEDLTSETFLRAMSTTTEIRADTVKAYLFTITRHLHFQQRKKGALMTPFDENEHSHNPVVDHDLSQQQQTEQLLQAIQQLPEHERVVLLLHAYDDMPYEEIATTLSISVAAAKVRVHRARFRLSELMKEKSA
ncbi:RNA polymerase sigma factor [Permianibacter sp. IMCC34836]|uniref:RNA polymerase sigma factor n=1 Tax=Permianibacter fluminis TaxID=2738515 RepID=UPI0015522BCF|nr:RNA polymerase sigma factor [Permianibacter fluminis]NQD36809.1 RNA polymerase sigma factor [Permianibacter fluminis]